MAAVDRDLLSLVRPWRVARVGLALVLLATMVEFFSYIAPVWPLLPILSQWHSPDAQYHALLPDIPYDMLRAADASLPRDASVLLVTPGHDVQSREYRIF